MKVSFLIICISIFGWSVKADEVPKTRYKKTQSVEFEGSEVDGVAHTPDGAYLLQKRGVGFIPLYDLKSHLSEQISSSVEYLK
jgi:hypothetical protein